MGDQEPDCKTKDGHTVPEQSEAWKGAEENEEMAASQSIRTWASTRAVEGRITSGRVEERDRKGKGQRDAHRLQGLGSPRHMPNDQVGGTRGNPSKLTILSATSNRGAEGGA
jgi:hypothetical protein